MEEENEVHITIVSFQFFYTALLEQNLQILPVFNFKTVVSSNLFLENEENKVNKCANKMFFSRISQQPVSSLWAVPQHLTSCSSAVAEHLTKVFLRW